MDLKEILIPGAAIGVLGTFFAFVLAYVAKKFAVPHDPRVEELANILPGLNCGGCGYTSCAAYAEALCQDESLEVTTCKPGGPDVAQVLAEKLGRDAGAGHTVVAHLLCAGTKENAHDEFIYKGIQECRAAHIVHGGYKKCKQGCLGFGDCVSACAFNAMAMDENGLPVVDAVKCVGCGACLTACPRGLMCLIRSNATVFICCRNTEKGAQTTKACAVGCIGCRLCMKECPFDAITIENNCAVIDYEKCKNCGKCITVCPRKTIVRKK